MPPHITLPHYAFDLALFLSKERARFFKNRFRNQKLLSFHQHCAYQEHIESIIGYLGEIALCLYLEMNPIDTFSQMIYETKGLCERDKGDMVYNNYRLDIKIEDFSRSQQKVLQGNIRYNEPYGCRLINSKQFSENQNHTDIYIFGAFDQALSHDFLLHQVKQVYFLGMISRKRINEQFSTPLSHSPAGLKLPQMALAIPNHELKPIHLLKTCSKQYAKRCEPIIQRMKQICTEYPL